MTRRTVWLLGIGAFAVAAFLLLFFYRDEYVKSGLMVTRVDRLTGAQCVMPCLGPVPSPTPAAQDLEAQRAIALVRQRPDSMMYAAAHSDTIYQWNAFPAKTVRKFGSGDEPNTYVVCLCDARGTGWRWEVHLNTGEVYYVNDNANLSVKYGVTLTTPSPIPTQQTVSNFSPTSTYSSQPGYSPLTTDTVVPLLRSTSAIDVSGGGDRPYVTVPDTPAEGSVDPQRLWTGRMADGRWVGIVPLDSGTSAGIMYALMWVWTDGRAQFIGEVPAENHGVGHLAMSVQDGEIQLQWPLYAPGDARCCPSRMRKKVLTLDGIRLRPLSDSVVAGPP